MSKKKIECYIDCVSPYSYFAFVFLKQNRSLLESYGCTVEFIPVFLGGINVGTGNKPPGTVPAKSRYSRYDMKRAQAFFGLSFTTPSFFPILSLLPQRCLVYAKANYPREAYENLWRKCFEAMWEQHLDLSVPENMHKTIDLAFDGPKDVQAILASAKDPAIKQQLSTNTEHAFQELGAFGCPWHWVYDEKGKAEPFFGSDRYHYIWDWLALPHCGMKLLVPGAVNSAASRL
ncbi:hypothetical protein LTR78_008193 [Recurvomyces mirabilis]|uniref:Glutathione S-transferase kappa n=1 Tax=Recurvomyces mirabilis TaxID=574656 RepID=A0AAE0TTK1_9PEZI|nr:hypothetical protein LTR78_008193 [Recurvomyces mirabilis]KAK5150608.1 hypothetical protein LTS14_009891 [Recurvomyces mirabilis]